MRKFSEQYAKRCVCISCAWLHDMEHTWSGIHSACMDRLAQEQYRVLHG